MNHIYALLNALPSDQFVSGSELAKKLSVSQATLCSWLNDLSDYGLKICSVPGRGYRLKSAPQLLDQTRLEQCCRANHPQSFHIIDLTLQTSSTNASALEGDYRIGEWNLYATEFQRVGRGRHGRKWDSPLGSALLFSLGCKKNWAQNTVALSSLITGLAIVEALERQLTGLSLRIKWPNDIYADGKKLAGILCELKGSSSGEVLLVIGVGLNTSSVPSNTDVPAISLQQLSSRRYDRTALLAAISSAIISLLNALDNQHPDQLIKRWHRYDFLKDRRVCLRQGEHQFKGTAMGIDNRGQLIVRLDQGDVRCFNSGEVSVRPQ